MLKKNKQTQKTLSTEILQRLVHQVDATCQVRSITSIFVTFVFLIDQLEEFQHIRTRILTFCRYPISVCPLPQYVQIVL